MLRVIQWYTQHKIEALDDIFGALWRRYAVGRYLPTTDFERTTNNFLLRKERMVDNCWGRKAFYFGNEVLRVAFQSKKKLNYHWDERDKRVFVTEWFKPLFAATELYSVAHGHDTRSKTDRQGYHYHSGFFCVPSTNEFRVFLALSTMDLTYSSSSIST